jgi:hypothetical protein
MQKTQTGAKGKQLLIIDGGYLQMCLKFIQKRNQQFIEDRFQGIRG